MKRTVLMGILLVAGLAAVSAQQWEEYDPFGGEMYGKKTGSTLDVQLEGNALVFTGSTNEKSAGYVLESQNLRLRGKRRIMLRISGIVTADEFSTGKLLKLELNGRPVRTQDSRGMNINDMDFINARNGDYIFDITHIENILKINLVFYNSTVHKLSVIIFTED